MKEIQIYPQLHGTFAMVDDDTALGMFSEFALKTALPNMKCGGVFKNKAQALEGLPRVKPDVVILDFKIANETGLDVLRTIGPDLPKTRWIIFTGHPRTVIHDAIKAGVHGCVSKGTDVNELLRAMEAVLEGKSYFCNESAAAMAAALRSDLLSETEQNILRLHATGKGPKEIAEELSISVKTVHNSFSSIRQKLGDKAGNGSDVALARYAVDSGIAPAA